MQGTVFQFSDLGLSFHFIKCRKLYCKKTQQVTRIVPYSEN